MVTITAIVKATGSEEGVCILTFLGPSQLFKASFSHKAETSSFCTTFNDKKLNKKGEGFRVRLSTHL